MGNPAMKKAATGLRSLKSSETGCGYVWSKRMRSTCCANSVVIILGEFLFPRKQKRQPFLMRLACAAYQAFNRYLILRL
jgi:hypothetical protein